MFEYLSLLQSLEVFLLVVSIFVRETIFLIHQCLISNPCPVWRQYGLLVVVLAVSASLRIPSSWVPNVLYLQGVSNLAQFGSSQTISIAVQTDATTRN